MLKTVIVVAVLAFAALQCSVLAGPVAEDDNSTHSTEAAVTDLPSTHSDDVSSTNSSLPDVTTSTTVAPNPSNGASSAGNCFLLAQVFAIASVTRLLVL